MQNRWREALNLLFGIGFKVGFLVALVGVVMMYLPLIHATVNPLLNYIGFWDAYNANPEWIRISLIGVVLMVAAVAVSVIKGWVEEMTEILFGGEKL
jgi:hypothetical protein